MLTEDQARLAGENIWLARRIARERYAKHGGEVPYADVFSDAQLGLIRAARKYDPARGAFATIAYPYIHGAITDGMRERDPLGRADRQFVKLVSRAQGRFVHENGRLAMKDELATEVGVSARVISDRLARVGATRPVSLDAEIQSRFLDAENVTLVEIVADPAGEDEIDALFARELPPSALDVLSSRERMVIGLRFWDEFTLREIGDALGVTESRVSQMLAKALNRLRAVVPAELAEAA